MAETSKTQGDKPQPGEEKEYNNRTNDKEWLKDITFVEDVPEMVDPDDEFLDDEDRIVDEDKFSDEDASTEEGSVVLSDKEEGGFLNVDSPLTEATSGFIGDPSCDCYRCDSTQCYLTLLEGMLKKDINIERVDCIIDNIIRCVNYIFENCKDITSIERIACVDLFYRLRHEILFTMLTSAFNLPRAKSDMPFKPLGIDSDRTPDLIYEYDEVIYVIEVSAVGNLERGIQSKGLEDFGFEGKYKREIDELINLLNKNVKYLPVLFNMSDPECPFLLDQMNYMSEVFVKSKSNYKVLEVKARTLSVMSLDFRNQFTLPSTFLFSRNVEISNEHFYHEFMYEKSPRTNIDYTYEELIISPYVYNKVSNEWCRLENRIVGKDIPGHKKITITLDLITGRFRFDEDPLGLKCDEILEIIKDNNKVEFFKHLKLNLQNVVYQATDNRKGVKFFLKKRKGREGKYVVPGRRIEEKMASVYETPLFSNHKEGMFIEANFNLNKYRKFVHSEEGMNYNLLDFDNEYEDMLIEKITEFDSRGATDQIDKNSILRKTLAMRKTSEIEIDSVMEAVLNKYVQENEFDGSLPAKIYKMKSPFIYPIAAVNSKDVCELNFKNNKFIDSIKMNLPENCPYTEKILDQVMKPDFMFFEKAKAPSKIYLDLSKARFQISNDINKLQKELYRKGSSDNVTRISKTQDPNYKFKYLKLKSSYVDANKALQDRGKTEKIDRKRGFLRLPTKLKSNGQLSEDYRLEMQHFKSKKMQSTIEGVGIRDTIDRDLNRDFYIFNEICNRLTVYSGYNPDPLIDYHVSKDAKLLQELKEKSMDEYKGLIDQVRDSQLGHSSAFISRLCYTLMYLSQQPFNSDYIKVDNLGYKNVLLMVRGGKKIFKSKSSKLFRLVCPVLEEVIPWYTEGRTKNSSYKIVMTTEGNFLLSPWIMFNESVLVDGISFYPRICSFTILNLNMKIDLQQQFKSVALNVLLAFHNRRQTEVLLANMRYILLSTLGDFTGLEDILSEFFGFNYDCFQSFVRNSIAINYPGYFKKLQRLKDTKRGKVYEDITMNDFKECTLENIFTNERIKKVEELTLMIYSTFLMTKAPYQKSVERASNLKGILKIHQDYDDMVGLRLTPEEQYNKLKVSIDEDTSYLQYCEELFKNDFSFDPKFCSLVGCFIDSELNSSGLKEEIYNKWYSTLNQSWDEMATSTGLRGKMDDLENFWGQKGYFIVYKEILEDGDSTLRLNNLFNADKTEDEKRKEIRKLNESFLQKMSQDKEYLVFHAVDKTQWKGSREIYVMDIDTKLLQQPIEKFMGFLCQKLDNELISIPSDKRTQVIHHSIFEKDLPLKETLTWYLTLDCTKWAPKSIFSKFISTFIPMSSLPNSFKRHFMNYCEKLYRKRIYFNEPEVKVLLNNPLYKQACEDHLIKDNERGGYYMLMPYSWVMGIFNYTSSFLHAANQKYMSYLLMNTSLRSYKEETSLFMFAHSDDSGGRLTAPTQDLAIRGLFIYEVGLKSCNHLLSKKKSVVSRIYFEILSIIYMFKKLLALLPKFLGGIRFLPTDKGLCQDMSQSYSKCIEVMIAGATFSVAYIVLKIYSMMVWRFYCNQPPTIEDYERPVQYMGMPDPHPLILLLCGSDSDIVRIMHTNMNSLMKTMCYNSLLMENIEDVGPIKPFKFEIKVKNIKKDFTESVEEFSGALDKWSIRNVNYHNTALNYLNFLSKLRDSGFVGSLVNESLVRRMSRAFFMRNNETVMTKYGNLSIQGILDSIRLFQKFSNLDDSVEMILNEVLAPDDIERIQIQLRDTMASIGPSIMLLNEVLNSPLKIYKYLEQLTLVGRKFNYQPRTLKPTSLQLVKSNPVFSSRFDEPTLVSYIKEPEMKWAINDLRGIFTAEIELIELLEKKGFKLDELEPDCLLRICRDFGSKSTKTIYLYSRVPSELRQVRSYSAFLTFLSVNSFEDIEITGLTIKLNQKDLNSEYTKNFLSEETYTIINILSALCVLFSKIDYDFFRSLTLKEIPELNFNGGRIIDLTNHMTESLENDSYLIYYNPYLDFLKIMSEEKSTNASCLKKGAFYTFLKTQKMRSGWYGKGELYISIENTYFSFILFNNTITEVQTNWTGKILPHHSEFILDVMTHSQIVIHDLPRVDQKNIGKISDGFGFDYSGHLSVVGSRELVTGVACKIKSYRGCFCDELYNFDILSLKDNVISMRQSNMEKVVTKKAYLLPLKKGEMVNTYTRLLKKEEFEMKLYEKGLETFEDFLYTELLVEYGREIYVSYENLFDNFTASKLFQIFLKCRQDNISHIPKKAVFNNFPASPGSLTRIFIDYGNATGEELIETNRDLDSVYMQVIAEFPDQAGVIMTSKLIEYFPKMFTLEEQKEISDEYHNLATSLDSDSVRTSIIKLMTYWGYGGLVNSIETFSLNRTIENYRYFNLTGLSADKIGIMADIYVFLLSSVIEELKNWEEQYRVIPITNMRLKNTKGLIDACAQYVKYISLSCFKYNSFEPMPDLNTLIFHSCLANMLQEEDFCASLQQRLSKNYILGSLPINYSIRKEFIVTLNTLRHLWSKVNRVEYELAHHIKNERLPDSIPNWKNIAKQFPIETPPIWVLYNGGITTSTLNEVLRRCNSTIKTRFGIYYPHAELKPFSKVAVKTAAEWKPVRPIKESVFSKDAWDDLDYEMDSVSKDIDMIKDSIAELGQMYVNKSTRIKGFGDKKEIYCNITILVGTNNSCRPSKLKFIRQSGQNVIWISTSYSPSLLTILHNCKTRVIQYTKGEMLFCYISFQDELNNDELVDIMLGKVRNIVTPADVEDTYSCLLRDRDGEIKESVNVGVYFDDFAMSKDTEFVKQEDIEVLVKKGEAEEEDMEAPIDQPELDEAGLKGVELQKKGLEILKTIEELKNRGISSKTVNHLKQKYFKLIKDHNMKFEIMIKSLISEGEMNLLQQAFEGDTLQLTTAQYKNVVVAPSHFKAAYGASSYERNIIKNKQLNAELNSLHESISNRVGNGVFHISKSMKKICLANLKLWTTMLKTTENKKESKNFAIVTFLTLLNCCSNQDNPCDDDIFHSAIDKISVYITDENETDDLDDFMSIIEGFSSFSTLKYLPKGT